MCVCCASRRERKIFNNLELVEQVRFGEIEIKNSTLNAVGKRFTTFTTPPLLQ